VHNLTSPNHASVASLLAMNRFLVAVCVLLFIAASAAAATDARLVTGNVADGAVVVNVQVDTADDSRHRNLVARPCNICKNRTSVRTLKLRYDLPAATSSLQGGKATCVNATYPKTAVIQLVGYSISVRQGTGITIGGDIPGKLEFDISGFGKCHIDASCSSPLVIGDKIGPFLVVAGNECPALAPTRRPTKRPTRRKPTKRPTRKQTKTPTRRPTRANLLER
jgi:hypothetical protein